MPEATIGVIGGSGLYAMEGLEQVERVELSTPFGKPSDAYVLGTIGGQRVAFLPRHGVGHRLTPSEVPSRANIHGFKQLGARFLISISAVGSLREQLAPGHVVIPDQLYDRTKGVRPASFFGDGMVVHVAFDKPFDQQLSDRLEQRGECGRRNLPSRRDAGGDRGATVFDPGRERGEPPARPRPDRHDCAAGGQAGARGRDRLRHACARHRLRLLAPRPRCRHGRCGRRRCCTPTPRWRRRSSARSSR